jgi:type IV secretory pathway TrbL component
MGGMLVSVLVALILAGLILWAVSQFPLDPVIVRIIRVVVVVAVVLWLLRAFGLWHGGLP